MDAAKLKGKIVEKNRTYDDCARAINVTKTTFNSKINGPSKFYIDEVRKLSDYLELSNREKIKIFLN